MQNTELFRRGIVLPANLEAEECLRTNDVDESTPVQYLEIVDQAMFDTLWGLHLFQEINARADSLIDDYEEEFIEPTVVGSVIDAVDAVRLKKGAQIPEVQSFLNNLARLASNAIELNRALLFVL